MSELNERAARVLGWEVTKMGADYSKEGSWTVDAYFDRDDNSFIYVSEWQPDTDIAQARLLEDEVERRGLQRRYVEKLMGIVDRDDVSAVTEWYSPEWQEYWFMLTATPAQRTQAAVEALEGREK